MYYGKYISALFLFLGQLDTFKFKDVDVGEIQSICLIVGNASNSSSDSATSGKNPITRSISMCWMEQNWYIETITIIKPYDTEHYSTIR